LSKRRTRKQPRSARPETGAPAGAPEQAPARTEIDWTAVLAVAGIALAACLPGVANDFAMDDVHLIAEDPRVHGLGALREIFASPYWPAPFNRDLYRPLSTLSFALEWVLGGGSPLLFRAVSYTLYAVMSVAVLLLARRLLPRALALGVALLFAAHPVHVEAVAQGVNQAEIWVALLGVLATVRYLDARRRGWPSGRDWALLTGLFTVACLFKEHALAIPGLLIAAELALFQAPAGERARRLGPGFATLALVGAAFLAVRARVLGSFVGSFTAPALVGQGPYGRTLTMLQVIPEWLRLLAAPVHLQGDYSVAEITQATRWGLDQMAGVALLAALAAIGWLLRRAIPVVPFGLLWAGAALLPVSNILVPTGIVMAERTLFLPSVGFLLAAGGFASGFQVPQRRLALVRTAAGFVVLAGVARSAVRQRDWRDHLRFWERTVADAPYSYKAHYAYGQILFGRGRSDEALREYHIAVTIAPQESFLHKELADIYRIRGDCASALDWYARSLALEPGQGQVRLSRIQCLMQLGRLEEATREAEQTVSPGPRSAPERP
jgi:tetratricopeptide (TPR) repeat protein